MPDQTPLLFFASKESERLRLKFAKAFQTRLAKKQALCKINSGVHNAKTKSNALEVFYFFYGLDLCDRKLSREGTGRRYVGRHRRRLRLPRIERLHSEEDRASKCVAGQKNKLSKDRYNKKDSQTIGDRREH